MSALAAQARVRAWALRELVYVTLGAMDVCLFLPLVAGLLGYVLPVGASSLAGTLFISVLTIHYLARASLGLIQRPWLRAAALCLAIIVTSTIAVHRVLYPQLPLLSLAWPLRVVGWLREANAQGLTVPREGFVFLLGVFLWWRGLALAQRRTSSVDVAYSFRVGVVILSVTTALGSLILVWPVQYVVFAYFLIGPLGIAFARADESQRKRTDGRSVVSFGWFAGILSAGLGVVILASALASILTGDNLTLAVRPLLAALRAVLVAVLFVAGLLAEVVARVIRLFFNEIDLDRLREIVNPLRDLRAPDLEAATPRWSVEQLASFRTVAVVGGGLLLVVAVALSVRWMRRRFDDRQSGDRESVWEGVDVRGTAGRLAGSARAWLDEQAARAESALSRYWAAMTIRRVYGRVLALANEAGHPRLDNQTPYEFLPVLWDAFRGVEEPLARITEAYVAVHYGQIPEDPLTLAQVTEAWEAVRASAAQHG